MSADPTSLNWAALSRLPDEETWQVSDADLITTFLPTNTAAAVHLASQLPTLRLPDIPITKPTSRRKACANQLAFQDLTALLENHDPAHQDMERLLLTLLHVIKKAPPPVWACALASDTGKQLIDKLVQVHSRRASLPAMTSHLVLSCFWAAAGMCENAANTAGQDTVPDVIEAMEHLASEPSVLEVFLGHIVYCSIEPSALFCQRGLATCTRAIRAIFTLQVRGLPHSEAVKKLCSKMDLTGRMLQVLSLDPAEHLKTPWDPVDNTAKGHSCGELYTQLLSATVTYVGYSSGIFSAPGGQMTLDGAAIEVSGAWLNTPGRLESLRVALDVITRVVYRNDLMDHVECPETRHMDITLRNLVLMLTLPLCCSKREADIVQLATFSMQFFHTLLKLDYLPLFTRMLQASHPSNTSLSSSGADATHTSSSEDFQSRYYQEGEFQPFFATVAGVMCDALPTVGASMGEFTKSVLESPADMEAYIKTQLPRLIVWSDLIMKSVQDSQQLVFAGRAIPHYRPATAVYDLGASTSDGNDGAAAGSTIHRRCATCGSRPSRLLTCKNCGVAVYCGRDCQLAHWSAMHKVQCKVLQRQVAAAIALAAGNPGEAKQ